MAINAYTTGTNTTLSNHNIDVKPDVEHGDMLYWNSVYNLFETGDPVTIDLSDYATRTYVQEQIAASEGGGGIDLTGYATQTYVQDQIAAQTLFSGSYNDLTDKPTLITSYNDLSDRPTLFSGNYNDLTNRPNLTSYYQTLTLNGNGGTELTISNGNTVNLNSLPFIQLTNISVTTAASANDGGGLEWNNTTGVLTFTPANQDFQLSDLTDVSGSSPQVGHVLKWDGTQWIGAPDSGGGGGGGIELDDLSVTQASASGTGSLTYNSTGGVFTYTPPDLSAYATTASVPTELFDLGISDGTNGQVLTTDGSGNLTFTTVTGGGGSTAWADITGKPTTIAGFGITDAFDGDYTSLNNTPTTLAGYGITDAPSSLTDLSITDGTNGQVLTTDGSGNFTFTTITGGGSAITIQDEGTDLSTAATTINFVGTGVSATGTGGVKTITINGGSGYADSDVDSHLNTSTATNGEVLAWNGTDYQWVSNSGGSGNSPIGWVTEGTDDEYRVSSTFTELGTEYTVREVSINGDGLLQIELARFNPTVSSSGQSLQWDVAASQFTVSVDNPTDFTTRYIDAVSSITGATGVHTTLSDYTAGAKSNTPAGGVDWTQTFSTNSTAVITSNGSGLTGGSASATITFADNDGTDWPTTSTISFNWQNANATVNFSNLSGRNFLETYTTVNYTVSITGIYTASNAVTTLTPTGGTLSDNSASGTMTFTTAIHKDNNTGREIALSTEFSRPAGVTGSAYSVTDTDSDTTISASFTYPTFYIWTVNNTTPPTRADIVNGSDFDSTEVTELGNQTRTINTTINNSESDARCFWFAVRTSATQPTTFQTGPSSALLSDVSVTTGNTVDLEPDTPGAGYTAEGYTLYGITLQPGDTYVRIS